MIYCRFHFDGKTNDNPLDFSKSKSSNEDTSSEPDKSNKLPDLGNTTQGNSTNIISLNQIAEKSLIASSHYFHLAAALGLNYQTLISSNCHGIKTELDTHSGGMSNNVIVL